MSKPWVYPCVMISLLLLALAFRWDYKITRGSDYSAIRWKVDRWTGQTWVERYRPWDFREFPNGLPGNNYPTVADEAAWNKRHNLTRIWNGVFVFSLIWLLYAAWLGPSLRRRRLLNQENDLLQVEVASESEEPQPAVTSSPEPIKEPIHEEITCYHCNKEYNPWKCPNCEAELEPADEELETIIAVICPLCQEEYKPWVCPHCGEEAERKTSDQISSNRPPQPLSFKQLARKKKELGNWWIVFLFWIFIDSFGRRIITISYNNATIGLSDEVLVYRNLFSAVFWALLPLLTGIKTKRYLVGFGGAFLTLIPGFIMNLIGMIAAFGSSYYMLTQEQRINGEEHICRSGGPEDGSYKEGC